MAAPVLILVAIFTIYPVGRAIYQSMRIESPIFPPRFVGLKNYQDLLGGLFLKEAAVTTLGFALVAVPLVIVIGVLTALLLDEPFTGNDVLRVGMLLPWALPATVGALAVVIAVMILLAAWRGLPNG